MSETIIQKPEISDSKSAKTVQFSGGRVIFKKPDNGDSESGARSWSVGASDGRVDFVVRPRHKGEGADSGTISEILSDPESFFDDFPDICQTLLRMEDDDERNSQIGLAVAAVCVAIQNLEDPEKISAVARNVHELLREHSGIRPVY